MFRISSLALQSNRAISKPTVVVVGTGWAGARLVRDIDPSLCNIAVLSQRNHMVFTPLLPQTCTGTLEFRSICEPITRIQPALAKLPNCFYRTMVFDVDTSNQVVSCVTVGVLGHNSDDQVPVKTFDFHYDHLVLAHGARPNTFNIPGVEEHAFFLREISEARGIRRRLVQNLMTAKLPTTDPLETSRLLHVVVVGGGPTGVEFAADLADFLHKDVPKISPALMPFLKVTLVEASEVLGTFDESLRNYGARRLKEMGVVIKKAVVAEVTEESVILVNGEVLSTGLVVWSTGVGASTLSKQILCDRNKQGRIAIDDNLQVQRDHKPIPNVYAIGDCAANVNVPLPTLAAVASRQGIHLAKKLNNILAKRKDTSGPFVYKHLGSMVSLGDGEALVELKKSRWSMDIKGIRAFLIWRSAYFTMLGSVRSRLYVIINWFGSRIFGRDITYISEISESKLWTSMAREGATREQSRKKLFKQAAESSRPVLTSESIVELNQHATEEGFKATATHEMSIWQKNTAATLRDMLVTLSQRQVPTTRDGFDDEFDALSAVDDRVRSNPDEYYTGSLASNMSKNRYRDVLPNEGTRVVLEPVTARGDGDYINANYIDARRLFGVPFVYIAAQAPTKGSMGDFWRMVWENNSAFIVMLCAEVESGKNKSSRYFPDREGGMINCGSISVVLESENRRQDTVFRSCLIRNESGDERRVFHMQHIRWPDQGIPHSSHGLMEMIGALGKSPLSSQTPIVVHCSGGIGRSGVFVALHVSLALFQLERPISIPRIVQYLKYCRTGMVQGKDQYLFLYYAVLREMEKMIWAHENRPQALTANHSRQQLISSTSHVERRAIEHASQHSAQRPPPLVERLYASDRFSESIGNHHGTAPSINRTDHNIVSASGWAEDQEKEARQQHELELLERRRRGEVPTSYGLPPPNHSAYVLSHSQQQPTRRSASRQHSPKRDPYSAAGPRTSVEEQLAALQALNAKKRSSAMPLFPSASRGASSLYPQRAPQQQPPVIHTPVAQQSRPGPLGYQAAPTTRQASQGGDYRGSDSHQAAPPQQQAPPPPEVRADLKTVSEASPVPQSPELVMRGPIAQRVVPQPQQVTPTPQPLGDLPRSSLGRQPQEDVYTRMAAQRAGSGSDRAESDASHPQVAVDRVSKEQPTTLSASSNNTRGVSRQKYFFQEETAAAPNSTAKAASSVPPVAAEVGTAPVDPNIKKSDYSLL